MKLISASVLIGVTTAVLLVWGTDTAPWAYMFDEVSRWMRTCLSL